MLTLLWRYLINWAILVDEAFNTLRGGDPGESISVAAARAQNQGKAWGCVLCKLLDAIWKNHCTQALLNEGKHSLWGD